MGVLKNKYTDGVILGLAKGLFKKYKVIDNSNTHIALIAPTRAGKGVGVIIPTLLNWQSSSIVLDLKKENYVKTAGFREKIFKHKIILQKNNGFHGATVLFSCLLENDTNIQYHFANFQYT